MHERLKAIMLEAGYAAPEIAGRAHKLSELLIAAVLDEVAERAYYSGDRAWSDELDRKWIELEFGFGELHEQKTRAGT